jgi:hypothetical protein
MHKLNSPRIRLHPQFVRTSILLALVLAVLATNARPSHQTTPTPSAPITVTGYITDVSRGKDGANRGYREAGGSSFGGINITPLGAGGKAPTFTIIDYALYDEQSKELYILKPQDIAKTFRGFRMQVKGTLAPSAIQHSGEVVDLNTKKVEDPNRSNAKSATPVAGTLTISEIDYVGDADDLWMKKDWTQWAEKDCDMVLGGSPWTQMILPQVNRPNFFPYGESARTFVQFRSALPIRQAVLRELQLENHYDKMKPDQKQAFDLAHSHDLDPSDQVRVLVVNTSSGHVGIEPPRQAALRLADGTIVQSIETNEVKDIPAGRWDSINQFEHVFPRTVNGKPLFSLNDTNVDVLLGKYLTIDKKTKKVIQEPFQPLPGAPKVLQMKIGSNGQPTAPIQVYPPMEFPVMTLTYGGKLEY